MYNDPSGQFIALISNMNMIASNSIMNNLHTLNVMGMIGGFMNATVSQVFDTGDDMMTAFIKGYMTGFAVGMVYIRAAAIAAFLEIGVLFHLGMFSIMYFEAAKSIGLAIACHAVGADKEAIMYSVIAVMCVVSACAEYGMAAEVAVTGRKGTVEIDINGKANKGSSKADFYMTPSGEAILSTGYRYVSENAPYLDDMTIPANTNGTYFSFDNYNIANPGALQVPHDASIKVSFDTLQIIDDISVPHGNWGKAPYLEPITQDFPQFGSGGATQVITHGKIKIDFIINCPENSSGGR